MKKQILLFLQVFILATAISQPAELLIRSGTKGFYLEHTVAVHEGLFPIGRMYNVHPRHIANFNSLDFNKGLSIGKLINIPLSDTNFTQTDNKGVPVYYKTTTKETLANVSIKYNKVPLNNLRNWNNLKEDVVPAGTKLVIGFLITNEMQDKLVTIEEKKKDTTGPAAENKKQDVADVKKEPETKKEEPKKPEPQIKKEEPPVVKEETKKTEAETKKEEPPVIKEEPKKQELVTEKKQENTAPDESGFFKNNFLQQIKSSPLTKEQTVTSSIFKTTSGWQDAKYYLLISNVESGTIVKITNPANNKIIYAKVLYNMDEIKQNQGLDMRISDAAASALAVTDTDKFILKVGY